jgi:hypothetical protein
VIHTAWVTGIRLDDEVRATLTAEAEARGIGLSAYTCQLTEAEAKRLIRVRIRAESEAVARYIASSPEAQAFREDWGSAEVFGLIGD